MLRPRGLSEAWTACGGAALMLICGFVGPREAVHVIADQWNVFGFFLGLMTISAVADRAGFFDLLARGAARRAGGSALKLYLAVFLLGTVITAVLSNDATALILTPVVYGLVTRLRLKVLPFMFACTFIADTASFLLPVSNPINILVLSAMGGSLAEFLSYLLLPALFCIAMNIAIFVWLFRHDLRVRYDLALLVEPECSPEERQYLRFVIGSLLLITIGYLLASFWSIPLSLIALGGGLLLLVSAVAWRQMQWRRLAHDISWPLFAFVAGMFVVIRGVENAGLTALFGRFVLGAAPTSPFLSVLRASFGTALGANLINNVPMTLVMTSALQTQHNLPPAIRTAATYAVIFGADLGPNLTTVGSLATILWLLILRRRGLDVSSREYFKLGLIVVPPMLIGGALLIAYHP